MYVSKIYTWICINLTGLESKSATLIKIMQVDLSQCDDIAMILFDCHVIINGDFWYLLLS